MKQLYVLAFLIIVFLVAGCDQSKGNGDSEQNDKTTEDTTTGSEQSRSQEETKALFRQSVDQLNNFLSLTIKSLEDKLESQGRSSAREKTQERINTLKECQKELKEIEEDVNSGQMKWEQGLKELQELVRENNITPTSMG